MSFVRRALATAAFTAIAVIPGATASAAADTPDLVRELATNGAHLLAQESELLGLAQTDGLSAADLAEARSDLRTVDAQATAVMQQLDLLGVDLSNAIREAMSPLPQPGSSSSADRPPPLPPPPVIYDAAIADLMRIAATPAALTPITKSADNGGTSFGLLAVAAAALLALGLAALANTLRRTEGDDDLAAMAWSDGLTGVANRRRLDRDIAANAGGSSPTAVIMVDVDHFKQVNDTYGHQVGDDVLRAVGAALADNVRHDDVVYRYGGEEFCVLLPGATPGEAQAVADRVVSSMRAILLPDRRHITVSVGVADGRSGDVAETLENADRALYAAKASGRDRASGAVTETDDTLESV
jgi:diguanylate cyclase (GGDEF)-like protein